MRPIISFSNRHIALFVWVCFSTFFALSFAYSQAFSANTSMFTFLNENLVSEIKAELDKFEGSEIEIGIPVEKQELHNRFDLSCDSATGFPMILYGLLGNCYIDDLYHNTNSMKFSIESINAELRPLPQGEFLLSFRALKPRSKGKWDVDRDAGFLMLLFGCNDDVTNYHYYKNWFELEYRLVRGSNGLLQLQEPIYSTSSLNATRVSAAWECAEDETEEHIVPAVLGWGTEPDQMGELAKMLDQVVRQVVLESSNLGLDAWQNAGFDTMKDEFTTGATENMPGLSADIDYIVASYDEDFLRTEVKHRLVASQNLNQHHPGLAGWASTTQDNGVEANTNPVGVDELLTDATIIAPGFVMEGLLDSMANRAIGSVYREYLDPVPLRDFILDQNERRPFQLYINEWDMVDVFADYFQIQVQDAALVPEVQGSLSTGFKDVIGMHWEIDINVDALVHYIPEAIADSFVSYAPKYRLKIPFMNVRKNVFNQYMYQCDVSDIEYIQLAPVNGYPDEMQFAQNAEAMINATILEQLLRSACNFRFLEPEHVDFDWGRWFATEVVDDETKHYLLAPAQASGTLEIDLDLSGEQKYWNPTLFQANSMRQFKIGFDLETIIDGLEPESKTEAAKGYSIAAESEIIRVRHTAEANSAFMRSFSPTFSAPNNPLTTQDTIFVPNISAYRDMQTSNPGARFWLTPRFFLPAYGAPATGSIGTQVDNIGLEQSVCIEMAEAGVVSSPFATTWDKTDKYEDPQHYYVEFEERNRFVTTDIVNGANCNEPPGGSSFQGSVHTPPWD